MKGSAFLLHKEKDGALDRNETVGENDLFGLDQKLAVFLGAAGDPVDDSFDRHAIVPGEPGDMGRRMIRMKVEMDGKGTENEEKGRDDPEIQSGLLQDHQDDPETEEDQKRKTEIGGQRRKVKMAEVKS
jgi:hypothetical protein